MQPSEMAISARKITRCFGNFTAVDKLDLDIPRGCIYGFLGPNGSGKSTTIRMLTGLLTPNQGSISILGLQLPRQAEALRTRIGYMTQKFSLFEDLTLLENLTFMARIYGLNRSQIKTRIKEQLNTYDLSDLKTQLAGTLSGGQKQRLALTAATIHQPELLFLDEPTSAVDPENRRDFWEKLFDLCDLGITILVSSHYMDEAERCHYLAILDRGIKCADDTPHNLMANMQANVVEITGPDLRKLKQHLLTIEGISSVAQQGIHLRVLVDKTFTEPVTLIRSAIQTQDNKFALELVRPSLEDVFVMSTGKR